jgi:hypothetical protein
MSVNKEQIFQEKFVVPVHRTGRATMLMAIACLFLPGLYLYIVHGLAPTIGPLIGGLVVVWSFMIIMGLLEPIVYYPILGLGGTYMSFLVGNVLNLRVPVSATAQQVVGTEEGTPEAEIVSTLGIAGSLIASEIVMIGGLVLLLNIPYLKEIQGSGGAVEVALDQVLPALFGALGGIFLFKVPKLGIVPLGLGFLIAFIGLKLGKTIPSSIVIPPLVIISVVAARIMYKRGWVKGEGIC